MSSYLFVKLLLATLIVGACLAPFTPPAVLEAGFPEIDLTAGAFPAGTEQVEVEVEPGVFLRGVFVPAEPDAPVVLLLLGAGTSVTTDRLPLGGFNLLLGGRRCLWELADLGLASLVIDYRGVGPSDGERSPRHLADDAAAMWAEAVRRAGGRPERVHVRGTSLGAVATAMLLDSGARPGSAVLVTPVRPDTVVDHFARELFGVVAEWVAAPFFEPVVQLDMERALANSPVPVTVLTCDDDELLPWDEREGLRRAVEASGGRWLAVEPGEPPPFLTITSLPARRHVLTAMAARRLFDQELELWRATGAEGIDAGWRTASVLAALPPDEAVRFVQGSGDHARLAALAAPHVDVDARTLAAAALVGAPSDRVLALLEPRRGEARFPHTHHWLEGLDLDERVALLAWDDPFGELSLEDVERLHVSLRNLAVFVGADPSVLDVDVVLELSAGIGAGEGEQVLRGLRLGKDGSLMQINVARWWNTVPGGEDADPSDRARWLLRHLLRAAHIPDRLEPDGDGELHLLAFDRGAWRAVDPDRLLEPAPSDLFVEVAAPGGAPALAPAATSR